MFNFPFSSDLEGESLDLPSSFPSGFGNDQPFIYSTTGDSFQQVNTNLSPQLSTPTSKPEQESLQKEGDSLGKSEYDTSSASHDEDITEEGLRVLRDVMIKNGRGTSKLEKKVKQLTRTVNKLSNAIASVESRLTQLEQFSRQQQQMLSLLNTRADSLGSQYNNLNDQCNKHHRTVTSLVSDLGEMTQTFDNLIRRLSIRNALEFSWLEQEEDDSERN